MIPDGGTVSRSSRVGFQGSVVVISEGGGIRRLRNCRSVSGAGGVLKAGVLE